MFNFAKRLNYIFVNFYYFFFLTRSLLKSFHIGTKDLKQIYLVIMILFLIFFFSIVLFYTGR